MIAGSEAAVSSIAAAIAEPARARMLYSLLDRRARTSTELAMIAGVSPSTASVHLSRLRAVRLVNMAAQGRHRYFTLAGKQVARALEQLSVLAGFSTTPFVPSTPQHLRAARTCYDHIAGRLGVLLHDRLLAIGFVAPQDSGYVVTAKGIGALEKLQINVAALQSLRRRFAYPCLDWSERQPHLGGALGAALLQAALRGKWVLPDPEGRSLQITRHGRREMLCRFGVDVQGYDWV